MICDEMSRNETFVPAKYFYVPKCFIFNICTLFYGARGSFLALSAAGHAGGPPVRHGASLGPGRAPWRVLWVFKVAKSVITGSLSAELAIARAEQDNGKPTFRLFSSTAVKRAATRSLALAFPRSYNAATDTTMRVRTTINTMRVWTLLTNVCDLCVLRVRVRVSAGLSMCVLHSNDLPSGRFMCCLLYTSPSPRDRG